MGERFVREDGTIGGEVVESGNGDAPYALT